MCLIPVGPGPNAGKTVAIILGGAAGVGFVVICLMFARNLMKKHDGMYIFRENIHLIMHSITENLLWIIVVYMFKSIISADY